jgi:hypothetical protein
MATSYTSLLGLALPVTGELSGTWGDTVNSSITALLDSAVAGTTTLSADADVTLTTTAGSANQARSAVILWTASNGATTRNITAPAQSKAYLVINAGTGAIVIRGAGPTTGVTVPSGTRAVVAWNGSDFVTVAAGYLNIPQSGSAKTTSYTLATSDIGKVIEVGSGGSITIPNAAFSAGDAVLVFNNTSGSITITCTITTAYIAGTDADKATMTLATRGLANVLFISGTVCVVSGNVS